MDSLLPSSSLPDPRDNQKYYFTDMPRRWTCVQITLLPPLTPVRDENPLALTERLMFTLAQALPTEMRGVYAAKPTGFGG